MSQKTLVYLALLGAGPSFTAMIFHLFRYDMSKELHTTLEKDTLGGFEIQICSDSR